MRQNWRELLFVHWPIPPEELRPLVPPHLELDLFEGTAYVGLVPFTMTGVRPVGLPPVRWLSRFHETNVRTYVHRDGRDPGVWFFSLDAANRVAVSLARTALPPPLLLRADVPGAGGPGPRMTRPILYAGIRRRPEPRPASYLIRARPTGTVDPRTPVHSSTSSSNATSSTPWRTTASTRAGSTITPIRCRSAEDALPRRDPPRRRRHRRPDAAPLAHFARGVDVKVYALEHDGVTTATSTTWPRRAPARRRRSAPICALPSRSASTRPDR